MKQTIEQALQDAVVAHKNGRLGEAERLYSAILQSQPEHEELKSPLHMLFFVPVVSWPLITFL